MAKLKNAPKQEINLEEQEKSYNSIAPLAQGFCTEIKSQIEKLLQDKNIVLGVPIEHRVKTWSSMATKLETLSGRISDVKEIQDLIGLRLILLFNRDVESVIELISENFNVISKYNTQDRLSQDQFGYSSTHFVVKLPESWLAVPTLQNFNELIAEIQIRTLAQHIWAAASHTLQYKQTESVPPTVLRGIYRVSALLETIDLEFERVLNLREEYIASLKLDNSDEILNVDLLEKILDTYLPPQNKKENELYAKILKELAHFKILTTKQLVSLIEKYLDYVLIEENEMCSLNNVGIYFMHSGMIRLMMAKEFNANFGEDFELKVHGYIESKFPHNS